ncbi:hypothetical protein ACFYRL_17540 [Streptomyces goshikiensis]|uniref:hypothetical protein n=1 Tax=Streptomyces goshikiensis TaxID=1942 RepID=UPI0036B8F2CE
MTTSLEAPARRRRHACLIAACVLLIGECAQAAAAVYRPIAEAPPEQGEVPVSTVEFDVLAALAPKALDHAATTDSARWSLDIVLEEAARAFSFEQRVRRYEEADPFADQEVPEDDVAMPTGEQAARLGLMEASERFLTATREEHGDPLRVLTELVTVDGFTASEVLDDAVRTVAVEGCVALVLAAQMAKADPSTAAEHSLEAVRSLAEVVRLASVDADDLSAPAHSV